MQEPEKLFYQELIQTAVALHHTKNRTACEAQNEYRLALQKLKEFPATFSSINLRKFREELSIYFSSDSRTKTFPKIVPPPALSPSGETAVSRAGGGIDAILNN